MTNIRRLEDIDGRAAGLRGREEELLGYKDRPIIKRSSSIFNSILESIIFLLYSILLHPSHNFRMGQVQGGYFQIWYVGILSVALCKS